MDDFTWLVHGQMGMGECMHAVTGFTERQGVSAACSLAQLPLTHCSTLGCRNCLSSSTSRRLFTLEALLFSLSTMISLVGHNRTYAVRGSVSLVLKQDRAHQTTSPLIGCSSIVIRRKLTAAISRCRIIKTTRPDLTAHTVTKHVAYRRSH